MRTVRRLPSNLILRLALALMLFMGAVPALANCHAGVPGGVKARSCCRSHSLVCACHHSQTSTHRMPSDAGQVADCPCNLTPVRDGVPLPAAVRIFFPAAPVAHAIFPAGPPRRARLPVIHLFPLPQSDSSPPNSPRAPPFQG